MRYNERIDEEKHTDTQKGALTAAVLFTLEGKKGGK